MRFIAKAPGSSSRWDPAARARPLAALALAALTLLLVLLPVRPASATEVQWVLSQTLINPDEVPREYYGGGKTPGFFEEERFKDMQMVYGVSAAGFTVKDRWQDREYIAWDLSLSCGFDAPETTLVPGNPYELRAGFSHSGTMAEPHPGLVFTYYSPDFVFDPKEPLIYSPSGQGAGESFKAWTFTAPPATPGAAMAIHAGLWNAPVCTVIWHYEAKAAASTGNEVINPDCTINEAVFDKDWMKYSDIDERIELKSRSWEAQQVALISRKIGDLEGESLRLQAEIILNGQVRREARELKKALVGTLKKNLIKSLFRLSILTADAVKTGYDLGTTYARLFTLEAVESLPDALEKVQDVTEVVGGLMPEGSQAVNAVGEYAGDVKTAMDLLTASDEETAVILLEGALDKAEEKAGEILPSWDTVPLSPQDIGILESQFLHNQALDEFLEDSYAQDRLRSARVRNGIPGEIEGLKEELALWEGKEKQRVREMLIAECREKD